MPRKGSGIANRPAPSRRPNIFLSLIKLDVPLTLLAQADEVIK